MNDVAMYIGYTVMVVGAILSILLAIYGLSILYWNALISALRTAYNHNQLFFFMQQVITHGKKGAVDKAKKEGWTIKDKADE